MKSQGLQHVMHMTIGQPSRGECPFLRLIDKPTCDEAGKPLSTKVFIGH